LDLSLNTLGRWFKSKRVKIGITKEDHIYIDEETGDSHPEDTTLLVTISNHSIMRMFITAIRVEWSWYLWLPICKKSIGTPKLNREEKEIIQPTNRFWIEAWGDTILSTNANELEYDLGFKYSGKRKKIYQVAVRDGKGKWHRSNKIRIKADANFW
jgi:hypothetical protein